MDRPKRAIDDLRAVCARDSEDSSSQEVLAYLDWLEGKHVVEWPKHLTKEWLQKLANEEWNSDAPIQALLTLAAIAPQKRKRVVNLWAYAPEDCLYPKPTDWAPRNNHMWRKVAGPIELEE